MEQVLLNLALNARDAMPQGGILRFEVNNLAVVEPMPLPSSSVAVVPPGDYVMLAVRDNGLGMEQTIAARAFEPFFTTKPSGKGTGLGLSTVYGIVKQSGGFVWIDSAPGSGTSVYVLLPTTADTASVEEPALPPGGPTHGAGTVLLVEDEPEVRAMLVEALTESGYEVVARANGREAIQAFEEYSGRIDLIVTDVVMPQSNGPALVRAAREYRPDARALYISGYADDQMVAEIEADQHSSYLQKPFSLDVLLRKIAEILPASPS
jgi:two-component system cell cycle sensor histidine kinase/response regulator CckA